MSRYHLKGHSLFWFIFGVFLIVVLSIVLDCSKSNAAEIHPDMTLYTMSTEENVTVAWDETNADIPDRIYQFHMWNFGEERKYLIGATQALQVTMVLPRTGLYIFYCRTHIAYDKSSNWTEYQDYTLAQLVEEVNTNLVLYETKKDLDTNPTMTKEQILQSIKNYGFNSIFAHSMLVDEDTSTPYGQVEDPDNPGTYIQGKWMIYGHVAAPTGGGVVTTP